MTEKRFSYEIEKFKEELGQYNRGGLVRLLLEMKEENEQLKYSLSAHMIDLNNYKGKCSKLEEENEQLKSRISVYDKSLKSLQEITDRKLKENEQLKQELVIYRKVASCSNCKYYNYDWYDDGDEFEVCDKGNDVTDRICEEWEEL